MDIKYNAIYSPREGTGPASTNNLNGGGTLNLFG